MEGDAARAARSHPDGEQPPTPRERFGIEVRVREVANGEGDRVDERRKEGNRDLVDVWRVDALPPVRRLEEILVVAREEFDARKVLAYHKRKGSPKAGTDGRDLAMLLLPFPDLKAGTGVVRDRLLAAGADAGALATGEEVVAQEIVKADEEDEF